MKLQDALFNWLQIKLVAEARDDDRAAKDTLDFFEQILREDHQLSHFQIVAIREDIIDIEYGTSAQETQVQSIDRERAEKLLGDINENPKYNQC